MCVVPASVGDKKVSTEQILTDGCGFMNWAALAAIARLFQYTHFPTAVQGRIAGSKGLWILHPHDRSPDAIPMIWIRPSQTKIKHERLAPAHLIFELVAPPRVSAPSRLSRHTLMVLSQRTTGAQLSPKRVRAMTAQSSRQVTISHNIVSILS